MIEDNKSLVEAMDNEWAGMPDDSEMNAEEFTEEFNALVDTKTGEILSEQEATAVDPGVQDALPKDARWHRREARRLLIGKKGMSHAKKIERMQRAIDHLSEAITMTIEADDE